MTVKKTKAASFIIANISLPFTCGDEEIINIAEQRMKRVGVDPAQLHFRLYKKSVDARKKHDIRAVCSVIATSERLFSVNEELLSRNSVRINSEELPVPAFGDEALCARPLVVGMGPCGMFAALLLAENGYKPILIDRGGSVEERVSEVDRFYKTRVLNTATNIQFGAGGAGTFSDGKLVTRINDANCNFVLKTFHRFGAPDDILTKAKPHIGTDVLRRVVSNVLDEIERLGGKLMYNCRLDNIEEKNGNLVAKTSLGDIECGVCVLAVGHSARDTYEMLMNKGFDIAPKPFSVGVRVEHLQEDIDKALFGDCAGHEKLGKGEYNLSYTKGDRGVYTFCMCPGGEVVAAASEEGGVVVNGMSHYARDGKNANSAVAVSVSPSDFGGDVRMAIEFQRSLERKAFLLGGGDYTAPCETMGDFMLGKATHEPSRIRPTYMGGNCKVTDITGVFPSFVTENLKIGFANFDKKISGFAVSDAVLTAVETRTSAPLTIRRNEAMTAVGNDKIYPAGEGAGYAGGITSAAVDGVKVALRIMARFSKNQI